MTLSWEINKRKKKVKKKKKMKRENIGNGWMRSLNKSVETINVTFQLLDIYRYIDRETNIIIGW